MADNFEWAFLRAMVWFMTTESMVERVYLRVSHKLIINAFAYSDIKRLIKYIVLGPHKVNAVAAVRSVVE